MVDNYLIALYSHSGNTRQIANLIHTLAGGTLHEIKPKESYPSAYKAVLNQAKLEIQQGFKPSLQSSLDSIETYDMIFIGSPIWWSTIAPPVATFLCNFDFSGKNIVPFCTHGGGGPGRIEEDIKKLIPGATYLKPFTIYGSGGRNVQAEVAAWLDELGITS